MRGIIKEKRILEKETELQDTMKNFIIKGNICHTPTPENLDIHEHAYLVCVDGISKGIFQELPEEYSSLPVTDYGDALIFPGMTDLHVHAPQFAYRGTSMDLELMEWLHRYTFPEEAKYKDADYAEKAYGIFADALKKGATTRACIFATRHSHATEILMELMEESGIISYVGKVNMDREAIEELVEESAEHSAADTISWIKATKDRFERTKPIITPRFVPSCTDELLDELGKIQADYGVPVQSHLSESRGEISLVGNLRPNNAFYGDIYDEHNLFGKNNQTGEPVKTIMAHCIWSSPEEVELMLSNGVFIAHCPASNMNVSSGIAPVRRYLKQGLNIGLGSDVAGGHTDSMFRAMTDAIQSSKIYFRLIDESCSPLIFSEGFYLATKGGGAFFGQVGSFEEGYEFDAVVLDDSILVHPQELTLAERAERAVYLGLDEKGLIAKYVAGRKVI